MQEIATLIGNVGFPIVMCLILAKQLSNNNDVVSKLNETMAEIKTSIDMMWDYIKDKESD